MTSCAETTRELPTVFMFWHGAPLTRMERLSMASFVAHGHPVELYVYDDPGPVPQGVRLMDAGTILEQSQVYRHRRTGSLGMFADWFRYRLLYERGGIWADTDVVCLQPMQYPHSEIFAWQDEESICGAVLGLPARHELAAWLAECCEHPNRVLPYDTLAIRLRKWRRRYLQGNRRDRIRWGEYGPRGLTLAVRHLGYADRILPTWHFYPVHYRNWQALFESDAAGTLIPEESRAVHLWNNMTYQRPGFDKSARFAPDSPFERLCGRYLGSGG